MLSGALHHGQCPVIVSIDGQGRLGDIRTQSSQRGIGSAIAVHPKRFTEIVVLLDQVCHSTKVARLMQGPRGFGGSGGVDACGSSSGPVQEPHLEPGPIAALFNPQSVSMILQYSFRGG